MILKNYFSPLWYRHTRIFYGPEGLEWLPNSDDIFACCYKAKTKTALLGVFDTNFDLYETVEDGVEKFRYVIRFHPYQAALAACGPGSVIVSTWKYSKYFLL